MGLRGDTRHAAPMRATVHLCQQRNAVGGVALAPWPNRQCSRRGHRTLKYIKCVYHVHYIFVGVTKKKWRQAQIGLVVWRRVHGLGCAQLRAFPTVAKSVFPAVYRTPPSNKSTAIHHVVCRDEETDGRPPKKSIKYGFLFYMFCFLVF